MRFLGFLTDSLLEGWTHPDAWPLWRDLGHHVVVGYVTVGGSRAFPTCFIGHVQGRSDFKLTRREERDYSEPRNNGNLHPCPTLPPPVPTSAQN